MTGHHLQVAVTTPLDRTNSLNVHDRHANTVSGRMASIHQSSLKDRWYRYSFRYRIKGDDVDHQKRRSNVEEFLFMESLPDVPPNAEPVAAGMRATASDGQEIELSITIRKDTIRRDLMDSMRTCNGRPQLMELIETNEFESENVHPPPNQGELDRLFCWAVYVSAPVSCLDSLYGLGANLHYSHCGSITAVHLAAFMGNADALR